VIVVLLTERAGDHALLFLPEEVVEGNMPPLRRLASPRFN
jgi:hypothetical protein